MKHQTVAVVLLALLCGQVVSAGPIGAVLLGGAQVAGNVVATGAQAALTAANTVKTGVEKTIRDKTNFAVNTVADITGIDWNKGLVPVKNFTVGKCTGNGYCFPKFAAAETAAPTLACPAGFTAQKTLPVAGELMCVKKTSSTANVCYRALTCPSDMKASNKTCLDPQIQEVLSGLLVAFQVKALLPFKVIPALATAVKAAVVVKPMLAVKALSNLKAAPFALLAPPAQAADAVTTIKTLVGSALGVTAANVTSSPLEDFAKGLATLRVEEIMPVLPELKVFVSTALAGVASAKDELKKAALVLPPLCCSSCCKSVKLVNTELKMPSLTCPAGLKLDSFSLICSGKNSAYTSCPKGMSACAASVGKRPVCVAAKSVFGMDSCAVLTSMHMLGKLNMTACP